MTRTNGRNKLLTELAERLKENPAFMAYALSTYQRSRGLGDDDLADELRASREMIIRLALCKRPDLASRFFDQQVKDLSAYSGIDIEPLRVVLLSRDPATPLRAGEEHVPYTSSAHALVAQRAAARAVWRAVALSFCLIALCAGGIVTWLELRKADEPRVAVPVVADSNSAEPATESSAALPPTDSTPLIVGENRRQQESAPDAVSTAVGARIDLNQFVPETRGSESQSRTSIKLPSSRMHLTLDLPVGSSKGRYTITIVDASIKPYLRPRSRVATEKR
jgi:hypothetical protein